MVFHILLVIPYSPLKDKNKGFLQVHDEASGNESNNNPSTHLGISRIPGG
jgi:hypothetical protein